MTKFSKTEEAQILEEARATLERTSTVQAPVEAREEFAMTEPLDVWRNDALSVSQSRERERTRRALHELERRLTVHFERRLTEEITSNRASMLDVVAQGVGEIQRLIIEDTAQMNRETFDKLSAAVDALRDSVARLHGKDPIDLPMKELLIKRTH